MLGCMGVAAVVWVGMFVNRPAQAASTTSYVAASGWAQAVASELSLSPLVPFTSLGFRASLQCLAGVTGLTLLASLWQHRGRASSAAIAMMALSAICFTLYCVAPRTINGSWFFPERFPVYWVMFMIGAAAAMRPRRLFGMVAGGIALCATSAVLLLLWVNVSRIAREVTVVLEAPPMEAGSGGVIIGERATRPDGLAFDPYLWQGAHYFRRSRGILLNAPWMDLPILMIRPAHPGRWTPLEAWDAGALLLDAVRSGDGVSELSFVIREGPSRGVTDAALGALGWIGDKGNSGLGGIYYRHAPD